MCNRSPVRKHVTVSNVNKPRPLFFSVFPYQYTQFDAHVDIIRMGIKVIRVPAHPGRSVCIRGYIVHTLESLFVLFVILACSTHADFSFRGISVCVCVCVCVSMVFSLVFGLLGLTVIAVFPFLGTEKQSVHNECTFPMNWIL